MSAGKLKVNMEVWENMLREIEKPGREIRWEHVPRNIEVEWNEGANSLAMEGTRTNPSWAVICRSIISTISGLQK